MQVLFFFLCFFTLAWGQDYPNPSEKFESSTILRENEYRVLWNINRNEKQITFEIQVKTHGWIGFGLSTNGNMPGSDIIMAWVNNDGSYHFTDRYAEEKIVPTIDEFQDWHYIEHRVENAWTIFKFWRKFDTCDAQDIAILNQATSRLVYAWHDNKPENNGGIPAYHASNRGTISAGLTNIVYEPKLPPDTVVFNFTMPGFHLPPKRTVYRCQTFLLPDVPDVHHIVKFGVIMTPGNERIVHHLSFGYCRIDVPISEAGKWWECDDPVKPKNVSEKAYNGCFGSIFGWAIGAGDFYLPEKVGMSFGGQGSHLPRVGMMEMHYDNYNEGANWVDFSGVSIYASKQLRPVEGALLDVLLWTSDHQVVPPGAPRFHQYGLCAHECLTGEMDAQNVTEFNIYATFLHSHLLGRGMRARLFKNGVEVDPIAEDPNYDFDFQESRLLPREIKVNRGDDIVVECEYDSTGREEVTYGGFGTNNEMCQVLLYVYPKFSKLGGYHCASTPRTMELARFAGAEAIAADGTIEEPPQDRGKHWTELMNKVTWDDQKRADFQQLYKNHEMTLWCASLESFLPAMEPARRFEITLSGEPEVCQRPPEGQPEGPGSTASEVPKVSLKAVLLASLFLAITTF